MTGSITMGFVARVGAAAARRPWRVVSVWAALLVGVGSAGAGWGLRFADELNVPGAESQRATDVMVARFPARGSEASVLFASRQGSLDPSDAQVQATVAQLLRLPHVTGVGPLMPSADGQALMGQVSFDLPASALQATSDELARLAAAADGRLVVAFGGEVISMNQAPEPGRAELIGLAVALVVMVVAFRSLVGALVPLVTSLAATGLGVAVVGLVGHRVEVSSAAPMLASMLGLGVGIDYALFFVTRYREERGAGHSVDAALARAAHHSGRAILFAGLSVVLALASLVLTRLAVLMALGLTAAVVVMLSVVAALTLLPALVKLASPFLPEARSSASEGRGFARLARLVASRPTPFAVGATAALLIIAAPAVQLQLGFPDDSSQPEGSMARRAYALVAAHYGPGANGPLVLVTEGPAELANRLAQAVATDPEVAAVLPPIASPDGTAALVVVLPRHAPQDPEVAQLVERLRARLVPGLGLAAGERVSVGGLEAATIDMSLLIERKLPLVIVTVMLTTLALLLVVFRSVLVALKAVLMNLLSVGAAYGVLVVVFQWGVGRSLIGIDHPMPIASMVPLLLFALLFGLSMDYEVFLLARVREEHDAGHGTTESVANALARTGRVVTAAATIMVAVFVAAALGPDPMVKMFGVGLAAAILLDATVVRLVLVPATMVLLGEANWWFPAPLRRLLPTPRAG